jgi:hypothetical protein
MARKNVVSLVLLVVLVLAIIVGAGSFSGVVLHVDHKSSSSLMVEVATPAANGELACAGCSGDSGPH